MRWILAICFLVPVQALGLETCDDLWFTRNLIFDRAGHCFGSVLGKAVFDNEGCADGGITLTPEAANLVDRVRALEAELGCEVDTKQDFLAVPVLAQRKTLGDVRRAGQSGSACAGWKGGRWE